MTTYLTIGRCALAEPPEVIDWSGDTVTISGQIWETTVAGMQARRQQLLGMVDNQDESLFPITFTEDSTLNGFYTIDSATAGSNEVMLNAGVPIPYSVTATRITGYASAETQSDVLAVLRTNGHSVTTVDAAIWAGPYNGLDYATALTTTGLVRNYAGSTVTAGYYTAIDSNVTSTARSGTFTATNDDPSRWYDASTVIEVKGADGNWYAVVGTEAPANETWRISNGMIRLGVTTPVYSQTTLGLEVNDNAGTTATTWGPLVTNFTGYDYDVVNGKIDLGGGGQPVILRNDPDVVSVRLTVGGGGRHAQTFTLRRGQHFVDVQFTTALGKAARKFGVAFESATACSDLTTATAGIYRTSNNSDGNREILMCTQPQTKDATNGAISITAAATSVYCGIGVELDGTGATGHNGRNDVLEQFLCSVDVKTSVVRV